MKTQDEKPVERDIMKDWHSSHFVQHADARPWPGRTGNTDKAVYLALCQRRRMDKGAHIFRASVRELSELANVGTQAVQAAVKRLRLANLVKYESKDALSSAALYSLVAQSEMTAITTVGEAYTRVADNVVMNAMQEDAFHAHSVGKSAYTIWCMLLIEDKAMTPKDIVQATGRAYSTVKQNLAKLGVVGLVRQESETSPSRWYGVPADHEQLHELAVKLGTQGKAAVRKARHVEERQKRASVMLMKQKECFLAKSKALSMAA